MTLNTPDSNPTPPMPPEPPNKPEDERHSNHKKGILARHTPASFLFKLLVMIVVLLAIVFVIFYALAGTSRGTQFLIEKIINETGVKIVYGEGNLLHGLRVEDVELEASEDISIHIIDASIKIGWRAIFHKEVHLRDATIGRIEIINRLPPTGDPYDYRTLDLPVNLRFDAVRINAIEYDQAERDPVIVTDVIANDLSWIDTTVNTENATLQYGELVNISDLNGFIDLQGDYPLEATAIATVNSFEKVYVDPLELVVEGSLKLTTGSMQSRYNGQDISGEFAVQGMEKNAPFDAKLVWDELTLPYAESQHITLTDGMAIASGTIKDIDLNVDTQLSGNNLPSGHYQGQAHVIDSQMHIDSLVADTPEGELHATGVLDWRAGIKLNAFLEGSDYKIRALIPEDFKTYAPQYLDGSLRFSYATNPSAPTTTDEDTDTDMNVDADPSTDTGIDINTDTVVPNESRLSNYEASRNRINNTNADGINLADTTTIPDTIQKQMTIELTQRDGEYIYVDAMQGIEPSAPRLSAPWFIDSKWSNVRRENIPRIGDIDSPYGRANVQIRDETLWINANARINELNVAPMGDYDVSVRKRGNDINISAFDYDGVLGDLRGNGEIQLATQDTPLTWQIDAQTEGLNPNAFNTNLPVNSLVGNIDASGRMLTFSRRVGGRQVEGQRHEFTVNSTDMTAVIASDTQNNNNNSTNNSASAKVVRVRGQAEGAVNLWQGDVENFAVKFDGNLDARNLGANLPNTPEGTLSIDVSGTPKDITVNTLRHNGEAGAINAKGRINLTNGVAWDINANADEFNFGFFVPQVEGTVTGDLVTSGRWRPNNTAIGDLQAFDIDFNGSVDTPRLPQGTLNIDASIDASDAVGKSSRRTRSVRIREFNYNGEAGNINAAGLVDISSGVAWDITADTDEFDIGFFVPQTQSIITGDLVTSGKWQAPRTDSTNDDASALDGLQAFSVNFNGSLDTPELPKGQLNISAEGDAKAIRIEKFSHVGDAGSISATGNIDITQGIDWQINAVMDQFNLGYFVEDLPSSITGHVDTVGNWQDDRQRINIEEMSLQGTLKGQPIRAQGSLNATLHLPTDMGAYLDELQRADNQNDANGSNAQSNQYTQLRGLVETLNADDVTLLWGDNRVILNGDAQRLQARVNVVNLRQVSDDLSGSVVGGITLVQPQDNNLPTLYIDLTAESIRMLSFTLASGVIKGKVVNLGNSPSQLAMTTTGLTVAGREFTSLTALFSGTESEHTISAKAVNTEATVDTVLKGGLTRDSGGIHWTGVMGDGKIASRYVSLQQRQPAQIVVDINNSNPNNTNNAGFELQVAAHCWLANDGNNGSSNGSATNASAGRFCLRDNLVVSKTQGQLDLAIQEIDTRLLSPFLPNDLSWQAKVNGTAVIGWRQGNDPNINATLYSDNGRIGLKQEQGVPDVTLPYQRVSLIARSTSAGLALRTDIDNGRGGKGYADVTVDPYAEQAKPVSGEVVLDDINVALFKPFFPGMRILEGQLSMVGQVDGTLTQPIFNGDVKLEDGHIAMLGLPVNLSNINVVSQIRGQDAVIDGRFNSGDGVGTLTGTVDWHQDLQAKLSIEGERLVLTQPPALFAEVTPDIDIIIRPSDKYVDIQGTLLVPTATLRPPESNEDVITESDDVVVLDRRLIGNLDEVLAVSRPWSINADIGVDLGSNVNFRGFGAVLPLAGAVNIIQKGQGNMEAVGVIQVARRSDVDVFGQSLELNYGQIRFNGDVMNPRLSIEADKEIDGQTVGVRVTGQATDPNIIVFNDAGLTEQQAMNALVTGRIDNTGTNQISAEGFRSRVTNNLAAAGLSIGLSGTRSLTNSIGRAFGFERLTIDASGNAEDTNVNVTGYITPDLYIRYGVGVFNAETELSMRYQLTRRIYVEATSATENAIDVVYTWEF